MDPRNHPHPPRKPKDISVPPARKKKKTRAWSVVFHIIVFGHYIHSESRRGKRRCAIGTPILQGIFCTPYPCDSARMPKSQGRMPSGARRKDGPRDSLLLAMGVGFSYQLGLDEAPQNNKGGEEREGENSPGRWGRGGASEQGRGFVWKLGFLVST